MKITDLKGYPIEITNLDEAIRITEEYKAYGHGGKSYSAFDEKRKAYWTDMYDKLTAIRERFEETLKF